MLNYVVDMQANQVLRDRLAEIDAHIAVLEAERKIIQKKLRSLTYPVLTLPFELTAKIFLHCVPDPPDSQSTLLGSYYDSPSPPPRRLPLVLSWICRAWRDIALKTPRLWAAVRIYFDSYSRNSSLHDRCLAEWATKAGTTPLSIVLWHQAGHQLPPFLFPDSFLWMLRRSTQWRDLELLRLPSPATPHRCSGILWRRDASARIRRGATVTRRCFGKRSAGHGHSSPISEGNGYRLIIDSMFCNGRSLLWSVPLPTSTKI
ncbi:hypothetical protein DFH07DRAFT_16144 [Mycena maculata]|uniref:F-box domain-containing protein n=1 Tax=Mycena maculata TaxID=230809 RepID=A0AAD7IKS8_9AGAR|nr:hypothetical protein DFH07DRAFT_16144 [Mycena maculata]